jgi:hypothetical protein
MDLIQLPQLVKEKIENYLYLSKWKENIVKLNQEYKENIYISQSYHEISLRWKGRRICDLEIENKIFVVRYYHTLLSWKTGVHYSLSNGYFKGLKRPKNYYFSSGLNDNSGYKNTHGKFYYGGYTTNNYDD